MKKHSLIDPYLTALQERTVIFDGAMGTNLDAQRLTAEDYGGEPLAGCNDHLNLSCPSAVMNVHKAFLEVGVDVIETNTFRSNRFTLAEFGLAERVAEINTRAAQIARQCADDFSTPGHPRFVAGAMGPSGQLISMAAVEQKELSFESLQNAFSEQARALMLGGADIMLLETQQDILEVKAAILGIQQAFKETGKRLPIQVQVTLDANGRMLLGTDMLAVIAILSGLGIDALGINCSTGPEHMRPALDILSHESDLPIACLPNAGMPENINGRAVYSLSPELFSDHLAAYVAEFGISVAGGCCGTTPEHLRLLVKKLAGRKGSPRRVSRAARLASAFSATDMRQTPAPLIIGERLNTQGSKHFKKIVMEGAYAEALDVANDQMAGGAHALDLCSALTERTDEAASMRRLVRLVSSNVDAPLVIDSTDPDVMRAALQAAPGRCLLNSINLEGGETKARQVLALARQYNAAVIALTIDEQGMAASADRKLAIARRIMDLARAEFNLENVSLVFDPLTFTLATGAEETRSAGVETLKAIRLIKQALPGAFTCLGVSNISYGLQPAARAALNSVFLYHAVNAGLDMAILNPAQLRPYADLSAEERQLAESLIFNRGQDALSRFIQHFEGQSPAGREESVDDWEMLDPEQRVYQRIIRRRSDGLKDDLDACIGKNSDPQRAALALLNTILLPAMREIGDQFSQGALILPFVLQSAEIMQAATSHLEKYLAKGQASNKGTIILATVFGDVHDIGKNLVRTILSNNGYSVIDLGKQAPADLIVKRALEERAMAVGLSALLVSTSQQMRIVVDLLRESGARMPVLIGGAAINEAFALSISEKDGKHYPGGVYYCRDAFDALSFLNAPDGKKPPCPAPLVGVSQGKGELVSQKEKEPRLVSAAIPSAPFQGYRRIDLPLPDLFKRLNRSSLFRLSWGARNARGEKWEKLSRQFSGMLDEMQRNLEINPWFKAAALYGYWPCNADGNHLIIFDPAGPENHELARFNFPRQPAGERLCLADYFLPLASGKRDVVALQIVTLGKESVAYVQRLHEEAGITESFYAHGLAVQCAEAAAQAVHEQIRKDLGLGKGQGKRYSWGYPALPDLSQHDVLFQVLPARQELDIRMTSAYQFVPEFTTAALVIHHPQAAYFRID